MNVDLVPNDDRCRYWAKVITPEARLPLPVQIGKATDIPVPFLKTGTTYNLTPGSYLIEGEATQPCKPARWEFTVSWVDRWGTFHKLIPTVETREALAAAGLPAKLQDGAGGLAACVRVVHALRLGLMEK